MAGRTSSSAVAGTPPRCVPAVVADLGSHLPWATSVHGCAERTATSTEPTDLACGWARG